MRLVRRGSRPLSRQDGLGMEDGEVEPSEDAVDRRERFCRSLTSVAEGFGHDLSRIQYLALAPVLGNRLVDQCAAQGKGTDRVSVRSEHLGTEQGKDRFVLCQLSHSHDRLPGFDRGPDEGDASGGPVLFYRRPLGALDALLLRPLGVY